MKAPLLIIWWLSIIPTANGLEAIVFSLLITVPICTYFIIVFRIIAEKTIILGPYINKIGKKDWDKIKDFPFPKEYFRAH